MTRQWHDWAVVEDRRCASYTAVQQPDVLGGEGMLVEDTLRVAEMPSHVVADPAGKSGPSESELLDGWRKYAECVAILGQKPGLPEDDAKAPGPKGPITQAQLLAGLFRAPGKWIGQKVSVKGTYEGVSMGVSLMVKAAKSDASVLLCRPPEGQAPPEQKGPSQRLVVAGVVNDPRVGLGVENADLRDCAISK
jgi:hypothetical protein